MVHTMAVSLVAFAALVFFGVRWLLTSGHAPKTSKKKDLSKKTREEDPEGELLSIIAAMGAAAVGAQLAHFSEMTPPAVVVAAALSCVAAYSATIPPKADTRWGGLGGLKGKQTAADPQAGTQPSVGQHEGTPGEGESEENVGEKWLTRATTFSKDAMKDGIVSTTAAQAMEAAALVQSAGEQALAKQETPQMAMMRQQSMKHLKHQ